VGLLTCCGPVESSGGRSQTAVVAQERKVGGAERKQRLFGTESNDCRKLAHSERPPETMLRTR
jgi:hypothetical protein